MDAPDLDQLLHVIDQRLALLGMSDREASLKATGKPDAIREMRRGKWPSDRRLRQIAATLESTYEQIMGSSSPSRSDYLNALPPAEFAKLEGVEGLPRDIPVYAANGMSFASPGAKHLISLEHPISYACRPPILRFRDDVFCILMPDTTLRPKFDLGETLYVDPRRPPEIGDYILIRFGDGGKLSSTDWTISVRKLVAIEEEGFLSARHDQAEPELFTLKDLWMGFRVIPYSELLSY